MSQENTTESTHESGLLQPRLVRDWVFSVSPIDTRWHPSGEGPNGEEVWCDGCCVSDKRLAQMIANNMGAAFEAGWKAAMQSVQAAIRKKVPLKHQGWQQDHIQNTKS